MQRSMAAVLVLMALMVIAPTWHAYAQSAPPELPPPTPAPPDEDQPHPCGDDVANPETASCILAEVCEATGLAEFCGGGDGIAGCVPEAVVGETNVPVVCTLPQPEPPDVDGVVVVREEPVACDAVLGAPSLADAPLPSLELGVSPPGVVSHRGLAGLESWFWAEGPQMVSWPVVAMGEEGIDFIVQELVEDDDGELVPAGPEQTISQRWPCVRGAVHTADVVAYDWELAWEHQVHSGRTDTPGERPAVPGDGVESAWQATPEHRGTHLASVTPVWRGVWTGSPEAQGPATVIDYHVADWTTHPTLED